MLRVVQRSLLIGLAAAVILQAPVPAVAQTSYDGGIDVGALLEQARASFDLDREDAVVLYEGHGAIWDGERLRRDLHRIVYIRTHRAISRYADLRVPLDDGLQEITVHALRVHRDGRWIDARPSAVVPTLPFAARNAYDYTDRREVMLLHDGVELPCILEVHYTISDREAFRAGADGIEPLQVDDPAVHLELVLGGPAGRLPRHAAVNGAAGPAPGNGWLHLAGAAAPHTGPALADPAAAGLETVVFRAALVDAAPLPAAARPAGYLPHVAWTSWGSWSEVGEALRRELDAAAALGESAGSETPDAVLRERLADGLRHLAHPLDRVEWIAGFVGEATRAVRLNAFPGAVRPRPAARTWATGYGQALDRAVLLSALLRSADLAVEPVLVGAGRGPSQLPGPAAFDRLLLRIAADGHEVWIDPEDCEVRLGPGAAAGHMAWVPGGDAAPTELSPPGPARLAVTLVLERDGEGWAGHGRLRGSGALSPYAHLAGLGTSISRQATSHAAGVLPGLEITGAAALRFEPREVDLGFAFTAELERDTRGRVQCPLGEPLHGLAAQLPPDLHLYDQERGTPVALAGPLAQTVELHLVGLEPLRLPAPVVLENPAGRFSLSVAEHDDRVVLTRTLELAQALYPAAAWPDLRALLLADRLEGNRLVLLAGDAPNVAGEEPAPRR